MRRPWRAPAILLLFALAAAGACAQKGFPPGGPRDTSPPSVKAVSPDSGSTDVGLRTPISIVFNEKMDKRSVEGAFYMAPRIDMESVTWSDAVFTATPAGSLLTDRTYTLLLTSGIKDRRNNEARGAVVSHFSTGDSVASGRIEGEVETGRATRALVLVWAYDSEDCPPDLAVSPRQGVAQAGPQGGFGVGGLETKRSYCVYAHLDSDGDGELDEEELFVGADSTVTLEPGSPTVKDVKIYLVPDDAPGSITGTVVDSAGPPAVGLRKEVPPPGGAVEADSALALAPADSAEAALAAADSIYRAADIIVTAVGVSDTASYAQTTAGAGGAFELKGLSPGTYEISAFRDLNGDLSPLPGVEPEAHLSGVAVRPGRKTEAGTLVLGLKE